MRTLVLLLLLCGISVATTLSTQDDVSVNALGAGRIFQRTADVSKATETGYVLASWMHSFDSSQTWSAQVSIQAERLLGSGILREAFVGHQANWGFLQIGYIQDQQGSLQFLDLHSPWSRFYERPLLWRQWGSGFHYQFAPASSPWSISTSAGVNGRESGFADFRLQVQHALGSWAWTGGAITYDPEENDNLWRLGTEGTLHTGPVDWHTLASYTRYLGANSASNSTMRPGRERQGLLEMQWEYGHWSELKALAYTRRYLKRYDHREDQISSEWLILPSIHWGFGPRLDWIDNDGETCWFPRWIVEGRFWKEGRLGFRIDAGIRDYSESVVSREVQGSAWMRF